VLAAADAIDAFLEAWQLSGDRRWLVDAVVWARRGLPFIYLWHDPERPFIAGALVAYDEDIIGGTGSKLVYW